MINGKIVLPSKYLYIYNKIGFVLTCNEGKKGESIKALEVLARQRCLRSLRELNPLTFPYAVLVCLNETWATVFQKSMR